MGAHGEERSRGPLVHSQPADLVLEGYVPWDNAPPRFSVLYSEGPERRFLRGRSWVPGTRDGMRWVLALSAAADEVSGTGTVRWHGYFRHIEKLYFCGRQGQTYEALEERTRHWLEPGKIDGLLERNRDRYLAAAPKLLAGSRTVRRPSTTRSNGMKSTRPSGAALTLPSAADGRRPTLLPDFLWDSFLSALLVCQEDQARSFDLVRDILCGKTPRECSASTGHGRCIPTGRFSRLPGAILSTPSAAWPSPRFTCGGPISHFSLKYILAY